MWSSAAGPPCPGRPRPAPAAKQAVCISSVSCGPPSIKDLQRVPPFLRFDPQEVVLLPLLQEWDALSHLGVADHDAGLRLSQRTCRIERRHERVDVVAVHALNVPAERLEPLVQRLEAGHLARRAVGLLVVDVDDADQVVELEMTGRPGALPDRALAQLAVREQAIHEGVRLLALQPEAEADGERAPAAAAAAGELPPR